MTVEVKIGEFLVIVTCMMMLMYGSGQHSNTDTTRFRFTSFTTQWWDVLIRVDKKAF